MITDIEVHRAPSRTDLQLLADRLNNVVGSVEDLREEGHRMLTPPLLATLETVKGEFQEMFGETPAAHSKIFQRVTAEHVPMRLARVRDFVFDMQEVVSQTLTPERAQLAAVDRQIEREVDQEFAQERRVARARQPQQVSFDLGSS